MDKHKIFEDKYYILPNVLSSAFRRLSAALRWRRHAKAWTQNNNNLLLSVVICGLFFCQSIFAQNILAPMPPMGWNSWDSYGVSVTEAEVKTTADYMAKNLKKFGWKYIVVDAQWYDPDSKLGGKFESDNLASDEFGRLLPDTQKFPSAANGNGFKPLADYIHKLGLKFGIHIMRGIPRQAVRKNLPVFGTNVRAKDIADETSICKWNKDMYGVDTTKPNAQSYYDSIIKLYADWGIDYLKADDISSPFREGEISAIHNAINKSGRKIVLSLSPGPAPPEQSEKLQKYANLWRISDDFWDRWVDLKKQFEYARTWQQKTGVNGWADADMLPLGRMAIRAERGKERYTRFTKDEQITVMTLWSIFRSPLIYGGDLPSLDAWTLSLISNKEVLDVNQHSTNNHELFNRGNQIAWIADVPKSKDKYIALFNLNDKDIEEIKINCRELGFETANCKVRDLWQGKDLGLFQNEFSAKINSHGAMLFRVKASK